MLKRVRKGITLDQARRAAAWCKEAGLRTHASFMVGLPGESYETMMDSRRFAEELDIEHGYHFLAPFPGTTVKEEIADYDLELLTEDWARYDANSAIVRTSHLQPEEMDAFVADCYEKHVRHREDLTTRYEQGLCSAEERRTLEGYYCCMLVYKLLSEDLIEANASQVVEGMDPVQELARRIAPLEDMDEEFISRTLKGLLEAGHLTCRQNQNRATWFWTSDMEPLSRPS